MASYQSTTGPGINHLRLVFRECAAAGCCPRLTYSAPIRLSWSYLASFQLVGLRMSPWRASQFLHGKHQLDLYRGPATNACPHIRLPHTRVCFALDIGGPGCCDHCGSTHTVGNLTGNPCNHIHIGIALHRLGSVCFSRGSIASILDAFAFPTRAVAQSKPLVRTIWVDGGACNIWIHTVSGEFG